MTLQSFCFFVEIGPPHHLPRKRVCPPPWALVYTTNHLRGKRWSSNKMAMARYLSSPVKALFFCTTTGTKSPCRQTLNKFSLKNTTKLFFKISQSYLIGFLYRTFKEKKKQDRSQTVNTCVPEPKIFPQGSGSADP